MSVEIRVPQLGESIVEATIGQWLKHEGDSVTEGEPVVELETEKVNMEVVAPANGVLQSIAKQQGDTVAIGETLAVLAEATQPAPPAAPAATTKIEAKAESGSAESGETAQETSRATPLARRIASEHGLDLALIHGSGTGGRITQDDVTGYLRTQENGTNRPSAPTTAPAATIAPPRAAAPSPAPAPSTPAMPAPSGAPASGRWEERIRMTRRRQTIARRMLEARQSTAMLTTFNEVDMTAILEMRKRHRDTFKERYGVSLGFMSFFTRAVVGALKAFPRLNAEIQGTDILLKHYYDIGVAVSTEEGLVVPVVRDADRMSFAQIEQRIADLARRARNGELTMDDLQGGTFTITNGGVFGSLLSTPILNTPQVGILGMHKIEERPIALNGQVVIRPMMYVALSYDHRIVDGSESVSFLVRVKQLLEDPEALLLEA